LYPTPCLGANGQIKNAHPCRVGGIHDLRHANGYWGLGSSGLSPLSTTNGWLTRSGSGWVVGTRESTIRPNGLLLRCSGGMYAASTNSATNSSTDVTGCLDCLGCLAMLMVIL